LSTVSAGSALPGAWPRHRLTEKENVTMKTTLLAAALATGLTGVATVPSFAHDTGVPHAHGHVNTRPHSHAGRTTMRDVRILCYRGPLAVTAWDHPEAVFVQDLINIGYDSTEAWAIGERVCKDSTGVNNRAALRQSLINAIASDPPDR